MINKKRMLKTFLELVKIDSESRKEKKVADYILKKIAKYKLPYKFDKSNKKTGSDAFLVEKKAPLVMPPNYEELPIPKPENQQNEEKSDNIKKLIFDENTSTDQSISSDNNNSLEKNILEKIKN